MIEGHGDGHGFVGASLGKPWGTGFVRGGPARTLGTVSGQNPVAGLASDDSLTSRLTAVKVCNCRLHCLAFIGHPRRVSMR